MLVEVPFLPNSWVRSIMDLELLSSGHFQPHETFASCFQGCQQSIQNSTQRPSKISSIVPVMLYISIPETNANTYLCPYFFYSYFISTNCSSQNLTKINQRVQVCFSLSMIFYIHIFICLIKTSSIHHFLTFRDFGMGITQFEIILALCNKHAVFLLSDRFYLKYSEM